MSRPKYDLILFELPAGEQDLLKAVGVRMAKALDDGWLRKRFWPMWDQLVADGTESFKRARSNTKAMQRYNPKSVFGVAAAVAARPTATFNRSKEERANAKSR